MSENTLDLLIAKRPQEGVLQYTYSALQNLVEDGEIKDFTVEGFGVGLKNPIDITCQPSYDGTVNLILNDDLNPPRLINTRFSKLEDNKFRIINRNQLEQTNLYRKERVDEQTRLFRNVNTFPVIDLYGVNNIGKLKGGNYTFYLKFADSDYNKTDVVCESGQVSIFKGTLTDISSISGTLLNEETDKSVSLIIKNVDTSFSNMYLYYTREYSDTNGVRMTEACELVKPYPITSETANITINGYEETNTISIEDLNIKYNIVSAAKTQTQVQNMLFLGNVQLQNLNIKELQNISYFVEVKLKQDNESIGWVNEDYKQSNGTDINQTEYYSPFNIYYKLGYWPDEIYRLGIVYIMNDDTLSPVFNLRGCRFNNIENNTNLHGVTELFTDGKENYLERDTFLDYQYLDNTFGVFKNCAGDIINRNTGSSETPNGVYPFYYEISLQKELLDELRKYNVKGYFIVRQKRIPLTLAQGMAIGIDGCSYTPILKSGSNYIAESFLSNSGLLTTNFDSHIFHVQKKGGSALLCLDANVNPELKSNLDGSSFSLEKESSNGSLISNTRHYKLSCSNREANPIKIKSNLIYVPSSSPLKYIDGFGYSTKAGSAEDVKQFSFLETRNYDKNYRGLVRGEYCPFVGSNARLDDNEIYSIKIKNYSEAFLQEYFKIRSIDSSEYFAISDRYSLFDLDSGELQKTLNVYRGDCYTTTNTIRLNRNFTDPEVPISEIIVKETTWRDNYKGYTTTPDEDEKEVSGWSHINRADLNSVPLGIWVTYKCLSNYNLGIRSQDPLHMEEYQLMGNPRSFYPLTDISTSSSNKIEESWILNNGYSSTVGRRRNFIVDNIPYIKDFFHSRVMFSEVQEDDSFRNAYRIFRSLDYKDIESQYGAIVKFISWGNNILCVFEHGIGIIPINEKALIQTTTNQSIHMYGAEVLQKQITVISPDFGSTWAESIIRTPNGVYGIDTFAKKIWRVDSNNSLSCISDMHVQQFLNKNIKLQEEDRYPLVGIKNVKSHYNNYKGDVMFTFYNNDIIWNLCYNERMDKWITRYSWTPLYSENSDNIFYSMDKNRASILGCIYDNKYQEFGLKSEDHQWVIPSGVTTNTFSSDLELVGHSLVDSYSCEITRIETSYYDFTDSKEVSVTITDTSKIQQLFKIVNSNILQSLSYSDFDTNWMRLFPGTHVPLWFKLIIKTTLNRGTGVAPDTFESDFGLVLDNKQLGNQKEELERIFLRNGVYLHGKAGVFNEIDYEDDKEFNQILPTKWYEKQEPFEFEFVVNAETGLHKIFDNLVIISNNVKPKEIEYEIEGDIYGFNKAGIYKCEHFDKDPATLDNYQKFTNCRVEWDTTLNKYQLITTQKCEDMREVGRLRGNIQYKEDSWYLVIDPIKFKERKKKEEELSSLKSTRIRDKYCKIRVKYKGDQLAIITALKTLYTQSYA